MVETKTLAAWYLPRGRRRFTVLVRRYIMLGFLIFVASMFCLHLGALSAGLACIWIANGLYIGFVLCTNPRHRNELLIVAFFVNYFADSISDLSPAWSLSLTIADMVQIFVATYPFRRLSVQTIDLTDLRALIKVGLAATMLGCAAGVMALIVCVVVIVKIPVDPTFMLSWFTSDSIGAALVIPLYWSYRRKPRLDRKALFKGDAEAAFLLFCLVVGGIFWQTKYPFLFLLFPVLIPVLHTSGFLGAVRAVLATAVIGIVATAYGHGPLMLMHTSADSRTLVLQFYLAVVLVTAFPVAALQMEREELFNKLRASELRYRELARLDGLTQLPNRREFDNFLDVSRQRSVRQNTPLSLLLIDIDHFKKLNDQQGHIVGDEYLRKVAVAVASAVPRKTDLVARYGGEEFGVILDTCDDAGAMMVAGRIKVAVAALSSSLIAKGRPGVTVSIGVATTPPSLRTLAKTLINAADQGLYAAKRNGRDRIERGTYLGSPVESPIALLG